MSRSLRRTVLERCGLAAAGTLFGVPLAVTVRGQSIEGGKTLRAVEAKRFRYFRLLAVSSDGRRMAFLATDPRAVRSSFGEDAGQSQGMAPAWDRIQIVDSQTWVRVGESQNSGNSTTSASFFADSPSVYCERLQAGQMIRDVLGPDLRPVLVDRRPFWDGSGRHTSLVALSGSRLLGLEQSIEFGAEAITLVTTDGWAAVRRVPLFPRPDIANKRARMTGVHLSLDRRFFAQAIDMDVSFRRSADLALVWRRECEPGWSPVRLGVSAHGDYVAVGLEQSAHRANEHPAAVTVLAGRDGARLQQFRVDGIEGVAISPDGKLVAVGERVLIDEGAGDTQVNVNVYEVPSGKLVAKLEQDRLRVARGRGADGSLSYHHGLQFTPDGAQLISSGLHTTVWRVFRG